MFGPYQQFLDDIERAIEVSGVNKEELFQYIDKKRARTGPFTTSVEVSTFAQTVKQHFLPIFIKLREMGYSLQDLRG